MAIKTKEDKRHLKRHAIALKRCLKKHVAAIKQKEGGITPSTLVAMIGHQPTSVLDLLEDDSCHGSTSEPDDDASKTVGQICVMEMLP
jgi:hypothetical protein